MFWRAALTHYSLIPAGESNTSMAKILFLFLDGVGLGAADAATNPWARAHVPNLHQLLGGRQLVAESASGQPVSSRATLLALDACLGVAGLPQSATGQAALLTGINVPSELGYHYGPKPNPEVAAYLQNGSIFSQLRQAGLRANFLNAYPPAYFQAIRSGRRLYSAIPLAVTAAGMPLHGAEDLAQGRALSADFTAQGWHSHLQLPDTPLLGLAEAGKRLAELAQGVDFAFFEYWLSDYAGHRQDMAQAVSLLEDFDQVLGGLLAAWDDETGLVLLTSDHGNLEDLSTRRHTANPVPALLIGAPALRQQFAAGLANLTGVAGKIMQIIAEA